MSVLDVLPEFLGAIGAAATVTAITAAVRSFRARRASAATSSLPAGPLPPTDPTTTTPNATIRHFTLLGTTSISGEPVKITTTRQTGTTITYLVHGHTERFELTSAQLHDGTFAAEPIDRYQ